MRNQNVLFRFACIFFVLLPLISCAVSNEITSTPTNPAKTILPSSTAIQDAPTVTASLSTATQLSIPDGRIAYTDGKGLHVVDTTGKVLSDIAVTDYTGFEMLYSNPAWSPDGHWLAFIGTELRNINGGTYGYPDIYTVKADGTKLKRLTFMPQYFKSNLSWSPDGKFILTRMGISIDTAPSKYGLYLINSDNGVVNHQLNEDVGGIISWSMDGNKIIFSDHDNENLYSMDENGQGIEKVSKIDIPNLNSALLSPNEKSFVYVNYYHYGDNTHCGDVFVRLGSEIDPKQITSTNYDESFPSWSPDGKYLLYVRESTTCDLHPSGRWWNLYVSDMSGNEKVISPPVQYPVESVWSFTPNLKAGNQYLVTQSGANLNLRSEPSLHGKILEKLPAGEGITVLDGFVDVDDYYWWKIQTRDGTEGWAVEMAYWYNPLSE